jgi:hypothetical protein
MPSGYVPGLPKPGGGGEGAPQWGTVNLEATAGSWNVSTLTLSTPADNEFWLCMGSQGSNAYHYIVGTSQHTTQTGEGIIHCHNGTNGWTTGRLDILKPRPGATWSTTVNTNFAGNYHSMSCMKLSYTEGFQIRPYRGTYGGTSSSTNNVTVTPATNPGPYPGGICVAFANHETGYASGQTGISGASVTAGWTGGTYGGALSAIAIYHLSTTEIETPPSVNFTTVYSPNCWTHGYAYIR